MSTPDIQEVIEIFGEIIVNQQTIVATAVFLFYDWILNLSLEIQEIWRTKINAVTVLYIITRYSVLLCFFISAIQPFITRNTTSCFATNYLLGATQIIFTTSSNGILVLRTWAIYEKNFYILFITGSLTVCWFALRIMIAFPGQPPVYDPTPLIGGCLSPKAPWFFSVYEGFLIFGTAFSSLIFVLTAFKTFMSSRHAKASGINNSLYSLILQDGLSYYMAYLAVNIARIIIVFNPILTAAFGSEASVLASALDPVIICLLTLRLRQVGHQEADEKGIISMPRADRTLPDITFASGRFLGNIGAPLRHENPNRDGNEDEEGSSSSMSFKTNEEELGVELDLRQPSNDQI